MSTALRLRSRLNVSASMHGSAVGLCAILSCTKKRTNGAGLRCNSFASLTLSASAKIATGVWLMGDALKSGHWRAHSMKVTLKMAVVQWTSQPQR